MPENRVVLILSTYCGQFVDNPGDNVCKLKSGERKDLVSGNDK